LFTVSPNSAIPTVQQFTDLGCIAKIEIHNELSDASFCGLIFDLKDQVVVTDPRPVLVGTGWSNNRYITAGVALREALLRAKGFSLSYQYAGNPILQAMGHWILRNTSGVSKSKLMSAINMQDLWNQEQMKASLIDASRNAIKPIGMGTRLLVERLFDITVEKQYEIEKWFNESNRIEPLEFGLDLNSVWADYWDNFTTVHRDDGCMYGSGNMLQQQKESDLFIQSLPTG